MAKSHGGGIAQGWSGLVVGRDCIGWENSQAVPTTETICRVTSLLKPQQLSSHAYLSSQLGTSLHCVVWQRWVLIPDL